MKEGNKHGMIKGLEKITWKQMADFINTDFEGINGKIESIWKSIIGKYNFYITDFYNLRNLNELIDEFIADYYRQDINKVSQEVLAAAFYDNYNSIFNNFYSNTISFLDGSGTFYINDPWYIPQAGDMELFPLESFAGQDFWDELSRDSELKGSMSESPIFDGRDSDPFHRMFAPTENHIYLYNGDPANINTKKWVYHCNGQNELGDLGRILEKIPGYYKAYKLKEGVIAQGWNRITTLVEQTNRFSITGRRVKVFYDDLIRKGKNPSLTTSIRVDNILASGTGEIIMQQVDDLKSRGSIVSYKLSILYALEKAQAAYNMWSGEAIINPSAGSATVLTSQIPLMHVLSEPRFLYAMIGLPRSINEQHSTWCQYIDPITGQGISLAGSPKMDIIGRKVPAILRAHQVLLDALTNKGDLITCASMGGKTWAAMRWSERVTHLEELVSDPANFAILQAELEQLVKHPTIPIEGRETYHNEMQKIAEITNFINSRGDNEWENSQAFWVTLAQHALPFLGVDPLTHTIQPFTHTIPFVAYGDRGNMIKLDSNLDVLPYEVDMVAYYQILDEIADLQKTPIAVLKMLLFTSDYIGMPRHFHLFTW